MQSERTSGERVAPAAAEEVALPAALREAVVDAPEADEPDASGPLRRCIATRAVLPKTKLVRFVVGPEDVLVPDVEGRLPGRGLWLTAERDIVRRAADKNLFAKAARRRVTVPGELADRLEVLLARRCLDLLGLARRAGQAVAGFEKVQALLGTGRAALLLGAVDAAADGRDKLRARAGTAPVIELFGMAELGAAFGREAVVHAAVQPGRLAGLLIEETGRLGGFRRVEDFTAARRPMGEH